MPGPKTTLLILLATVALVPLVLSTALANQFYLPQSSAARLLVAVALGSAMLWMPLAVHRTWPRSAFDLPVLGTALWLLVGVAVSELPWHSWLGDYANTDGVRLQLHYLAFFGLVVVVARSLERQAALLLALVASAAAQATLVLLQASGREFIAADVTFAGLGRFDGTTGNPITAGAIFAVALPLLPTLLFGGHPGSHTTRTRLLALVLPASTVGWIALIAARGVPTIAREGAALPLAVLVAANLAALGGLVLLAIQRPRPAGALVGAACGLLLLRALAETGSRSAMLGLAAGAVVAAAGWLWSRRAAGPGRIAARTGARPAAIWIAAGAAALAALTLVATTPAAARMLATVARPVEALATSRANIWTPAVRMWAERPLTGWGPDTFMRVSPRFESPDRPADVGDQGVPQNAHSEPLQLLATQGLVGLLLWLALLGAAGWLLLRRLRAGNVEGDRPFALGVATALTVLVVYGLAGIPSVPLRLWFWLLLAVCVPSGTDLEPRRVGARAAWVPSVPAVLLVAFALLGIVPALRADAWALEGLRIGRAPGGDLAQAAAALEQAVALAPNEAQYRWQAAEIAARRFEREPGGPDAARQFADARARYESAFALGPDPVVAASMGRLWFQRLRLLGDPQAAPEARRWYAEALRLAPVRRPFLTDAASLEVVAGDPAAGLKVLEQLARHAPKLAAELLVAHPAAELLCVGERAETCRALLRGSQH